MRGLTNLERALLLRRANGIERALFPADSMAGASFQALRHHGRMVGAEESPDLILNEITDLGRLALRVCPVEES